MVASTLENEKKRLQYLLAYKRLTPSEQEFCQACAVAMGKKGPVSVLLHYFKMVGLTLDGKQIDAARLKLIVSNLERALLLDGTSFTVNPILQHTLLKEAFNGPRKKLYMEAWGLVNGCRAVFYVTPEERKLQSAIRIYALAKDQVQEAQKIVDSGIAYDALDCIFSFYVNDPEWINQLPAPIQFCTYHYHFNCVWTNGAILPDFPSILALTKMHAEKNQWSGLTKLLVQHAVYSADLRLSSASKNCPANTEESSYALASFAFLKGEYSHAIILFDEKLKLVKKRLGLRKYFLDGVGGIYYTLALLQAQNPSMYPQIREWLAWVCDKSESFFKPAFMALSDLLDSLENGSVNQESSFFHRMREENPINFAVMWLCNYWIDRQRKIPSDKLQTMFLSTKDSLPGIARILAELGAKMVSDPAIYKEYLQESTECYAISFVDIIPYKESWESSLQLIENAFVAKNHETSNGKYQANETAQRLLWQVDLSRQCVVGALEQKLGAKGVWSKGRSVSLEKLKTRSSEFSFLSPHDHKIIQCICDESSLHGYYRRVEWNFDQQKAFLALVGHANVVDTHSGLSIELVQGSVELLVQDNDDHYKLSLSGVHDEPCILLKKETDTRIQVINFTPEHVKLHRAIGTANALQIPKAEKNRLKTILKAVEMQVPVHSELDDDSARKPGDPSLNVQLVPLDHGIKVNLLARPFGAEGPCFRPGQGFQSPQAVIKGESQRVYRNLTEERAEADRMIQSVQALSMNDSGTDEWIFDEPAEALEALSEIHGYPHPIKMLWPLGQKWHVSAPTNAKSLQLQITQDRNWFALEGKLQINEEQVIELKQLLALVDASDQRFVPIGDKQFLALTDHFKRQLRELKALTEQSQDKIWLHPLASCALHDLLQEAGECRADKHWKLVKERIQSSQAHNPVVPAALQAELRPYQIEGFQWLSRLARWGVGGCLADDMGLGKTLQALALILEQASLGPTLVVAPTSVCYNWLNEAKRFAPTLEVMLHAHQRKPEVIQALGPQQVLITSYGLLHLESELLSGVKWQTIILDEAQSIKNIHAKRSQAAQQLQGQVKMILTGTPLENRLSDLWNLFRFINPGLLGSYESFNKRFGEPIEQRKDAAARHALKKLIQPFVLRRLKTQVLAELPPRTEKTIVVPLTKEEKAFYEALRRTALEKLSAMSVQEKKRMHILAEIMRLRRACCHSGLVAPEIDIPSSKLTLLAELLDELKENNHRALVFSQFVGFLEKTRALLDEKKISYQYLDGSTPIDERMKRVNAFQKGEGDLFLISLKAGGTGLNLTGADFVIHLDPWWNPAVEDQASDRAHRMGQTRPVTIYRLIMEGTIEEKMLKLHEDKRGMANDLLEGTDTSNKMTEEELLALLD